MAKRKNISLHEAYTSKEEERRLQNEKLKESFCGLCGKPINEHPPITFRPCPTTVFYWPPPKLAS